MMSENPNELRKRVLAHRGAWTDDRGKVALRPNSREAINAAIAKGFGLEIDLRDYLGQVVISHDPATDNSEFFSCSDLTALEGVAALNVKSDGLLELQSELPSSVSILGPHFYFDMSFPEQRKYEDFGLPTASRVSDLEPMPEVLGDWLWLDSWKSDWLLKSRDFLEGLKPSTKVVVVSAELHRRPYMDLWEFLCPLMLQDSRFHICTDYPELFCSFFEEDH